MGLKTPEISKLRGEKGEYHDSFHYLLDILKMEIGIIDHAIARIDHTTTVQRNWAVVLWAGGIGLALKQPELQKYIIFTAVIPLLFWVITMRWLYYLSGFLYREKRISEFLHSDDFQMSFKQGKMINFQVLDPTGVQHQDEERYKQEVSLRRALKFKEIKIFYFGMVFLSLLTGICFLILQ